AGELNARLGRGPSMARPAASSAIRAEEGLMASGTAATTLLEAAREFRPRILTRREQIEAGRRLPDELTGELARVGFFRATLPAAYDGLDLSPLEALEVYEELARADGSVAW